jgi:hypothetical protein
MSSAPVACSVPTSYIAHAAAFALTCAAECAPGMTVVTPSCAITHARAACAVVPPSGTWPDSGGGRLRWQ